MLFIQLTTKNIYTAGSEHSSIADIKVLKSISLVLHWGPVEVCRNDAKMHNEIKIY